MSGPKGRIVKFTRTSVAETLKTGPQGGRNTEWVTDAEFPQLKMRLRIDHPAGWYISFKHPATGERKRKKLSNVDPKQHPDKIRDLAREFAQTATRAMIIDNEGKSFDNRDVTVAEVISAYIENLRTNPFDDKPRNEKTIAGYETDLKRLEVLFEGIKATDLTLKTVEQRFAENMARIKTDQENKIQQLQAELTANTDKVKMSNAYGLTLRNVNGLENRNRILRERIARLQSPKTTGASHNRNMLRLLNAAFRAVGTWDNYPDLPPGFKIKQPKYKPKMDRSLSQAQIMAVKNLCTAKLANRANDETWEHACLIMCLIYSGARKTEFLSADVSGVKITNDKISVKCPNNKEKNTYKEIAVMRQAEPFLEALVDNRKTGPLFARTKYPDTAARKIMVDAGVEDWTGFHDLRHTFASIAYASGASLTQLAHALGQSSLTVTQNYGYLFKETHEQMIENMEITELNFQNPNN